MPDLATNVLYYGDNLDILRRYLPDASVDLVNFRDTRFACRHPTRVSRHTSMSRGHGGAAKFWLPSTGFVTARGYNRRR